MRREDLFRLVEQDGGLTGFPVNLGGVGPAAIEGIL